MHDATVSRRWPEIIPYLDRHQLNSAYLPADDESVDSCITVYPAGKTADDDIGDIQLADDHLFIANAWADADHTTRAHGPMRTTAEEAVRDLIGLLERYHIIAAQ